MDSPELSWCRHCGLPRRMTREHAPPRTVGNDQPVGRIDEPFDQNAVVREVAEWREGHVRTLSIPTADQLVGWARAMLHPADYVSRLDHP